MWGPKARSWGLLLPVVLGLLVSLTGVAHADVTSVENGTAAGPTIRFDGAGDALDAHDGEIEEFGGTYYLYGTSYGCGYVRLSQPTTPWCGARAYQSTDLVHWQSDGYLFDPLPWQSRCNSLTLSCYRPHVLHNPVTGNYVLWVNSYDVGVGYHVFLSRSPTGPFVETNLPTLGANGGGDFDLFQDDDGTAYIAFTLRGDNYNIGVQQLNAAYTSGTGAWSSLGMKSVESPSLFKRAGRYFLTVSDPNCAYCEGTGTAYLQASSPLGPWRGHDQANVQNVGNSLYDQGVNGLAVAGTGWRDYVTGFRVTPLKTGGGGRYAQAGWFLRARDVRNGYRWVIGNYPYAGATGGNLTKAVYVNGAVVSKQVVRLPMPITPGQTYSVSSRVAGGVITTSINGRVVDVTRSTRFASGSTGPTEYKDESAYFDDYVVRSLTGGTLLADSFGGYFRAWTFASLRRQGWFVSFDSCQGQPADVAALRSPDGHAYLFQTDRWNNSNPNQGLALHYWEPLQFDAAGNLRPLTCGERYTLDLTAATSTADPVPRDQVATSGAAGFHRLCKVRAGVARAQTFSVPYAGTLTRAAVSTYQYGSPNAPLTVAVTDTDSLDRPRSVLYSRTFAAAETAWSPVSRVLTPDLRVLAGHRYAIALTSAATDGCYGSPRSDTDRYGGGTSYVRGGFASWVAEAQDDLKFQVSVAP